MTAHFNSLSDGAYTEIINGPVAVEDKPGIYRNFVKRVLETLLVLAASPILVPLIVLLSIPLVLKGKNPFYAQRRVGRGGREFTMWKMKSMVCDADERLAAHLRENPDARDEWSRLQKLHNDPRVTSYGRFLRRTSLDEIPQFLHVLTGEMALVGPRPMMPHQRALYDGDAYFCLRPGITGYWQVSDRNDSEFVTRVAFDEKYDQEISLKTDIVVLSRTVGAVLKGTGV